MRDTRKQKTAPNRTLGGIAVALVLLAAFCFLTYRQEHSGRRPFEAQETTRPSGGSAVPFSGDEPSLSTADASPDSIPDYSGEDYIVLNDNLPNFTAYDLSHITGEQYAELDALGRCGAACAMLERSMMPEEERGEISEIKPSGWHTATYPELIEDRFLYHRCHLIAFALTGQNANERNLITGTCYMNEVSMLAFEIEVMEYLDRSDGHVLYRVTPLFRDDELVARGVEIEAYSVEDGGAGLCRHVFVYNQQPGIEIDYRTGESRVAESREG